MQISNRPLNHEVNCATRKERGRTKRCRLVPAQNLVLISAALLLSNASKCCCVTPARHSSFIAASSSSSEKCEILRHDGFDDVRTRKLRFPSYSQYQESRRRKNASMPSNRNGNHALSSLTSLSALNCRTSSLLILNGSNNGNDIGYTWSRALPSLEASATEEEEGQEEQRSESRFGVRRRVRSVLAKARNRTGIRNNCDDEEKEQLRKVKTASAPSIVADAASIGGLGAVVVDERGTVDVAFDYVAPKNGQSTSKDEGRDFEATGTLLKGEGLADKALAAGVQRKNVTSASGGQKKKEKKSSPASTYSPPFAQVDTQPEDNLIPASIKKAEEKPTPLDAIGKTKKPERSKSSYNNTGTGPLTEMDAVRTDLPAAALPPPPLPFTLPTLTSEQKARIDAGERVEFQTEMGRDGSGFVVVDVKAPPDVVWDCLLDFRSYPQTIPTVRGVTMYTNTHLKSDYRSEKPLPCNDGTVVTLKHGVPSVTRAAFILSKFRLKIAAIHKYRPHPQGDYMVFTLDPACTNLVLRSAKGVWHTQANPDGKGEEYTRVWLLCELRVSRALPSWIVDYAAKRAMPRATSWLKPQVEAAASLWLRKDHTDEKPNGEGKEK